MGTQVRWWNTCALAWNRASLRIFGEERRVVAELLTSAGYEFYRPDETGQLQPTDQGTLGSDVFAVLGPFEQR